MKTVRLERDGKAVYLSNEIQIRAYEAAGYKRVSEPKRKKVAEDGQQ